MAEQHPESSASQPPTTFAPPTHPPASFLPPEASPAPTTYAPPAGPAASYAPPSATFAYAPPAATAPPTTYPAPGDHAPSAYPPATAEPAEPEAVGRGLVFSLGGIVLGVVAAIVFRQLNAALSLSSMKLEFVLSAVPGLVMAYASVWLYTKGARTGPRKGLFPLLVVIVIGILAALTSALGADAMRMAMKIYPGDSGAQVSWVLEYLANPEVWTERGGSLILYVIAAGIGSFSVFSDRFKRRG
ncbi:hypothetical protein [Propionicimonas sp.]|uniref:hypothetical protein n=1 Tax=Propionicimonas sp. TaxID=1955623 RepID=UPI0017F81402|nr:hypothetical protein [Propionicimonas sp.]MBU3977121.1 hypothetical protein [Actinomycetota bacterium]MBA3020690.1 hypothetical protein [Propionicimonas sp.]MBU3985061.1 hypothetical protein [Actinomycetota bacterium]MBU4006982.1 hypothetical protein [Actinomycetota bacterium]MBU4064735.1 hypothetical protein [Actinomycetota bacterium]